MTDDLQPLRLLLAQAERQRDEALADQSRAETLRRSAVAQAEDLVVYRREYEQRWSAQFCREGQIELVRCYQGFMERLSQAVDQQARAAAQAAVQVEHISALVRSHDMRAAGLKKLIGRRVQEAARQVERGEQAQSDERAARATWTQMNQGGFSPPPEHAA